MSVKGRGQSKLQKRMDELNLARTTRDLHALNYNGLSAPGNLIILLHVPRHFSTLLLLFLCVTREL